MSMNEFDRLLAPKMLEKTPWEGRKLPPYPHVENTVSGSMWLSIKGGHKWLGYFSHYDREFSRFRGKKPKILEIGVYRGASLRLWSRFFGAGSTIVGIDLNPDCAKSNNPEHNIFVEIGDQSDPAFLKHIVDTYGPFDLIIDDGSHVASHQIASFNGLFLDGLKNHGVYFIEDLECMYWGDRSDYRDAEVTSTDFFKHLVDVQNSIFSDYTYEQFIVHKPSGLEQYVNHEIAKHLSSIRFSRGIVVIEKELEPPPQVLHL